MIADPSSLSVTPEQVLTLAGRLDDVPGFDTPRERFRRFLTERVTTMAVARALIEQWQHSTGEQHHRALQDAVVVLGRLLGFETTFGMYQPGPGLARCDGFWRSRHRLEIVLELRSHQTPRADLDSLFRSIDAPASSDPEVKRLGLCVVTPFHAGRTALEDLFASGRANGELRMVSTRSLLSLADMVTAGRLKHDELVKLLDSSSNLDFLVDLLQRASSQTAASPEDREGAISCWLSLIAPDGAAAPQDVIQLLIGRRQILGVTDALTVEHPPKPDDAICFLVPGAGVVGEARIASLAEEGVYLLRDSDRFSRVIRLRDVELYDLPKAVDAESEQRLMEMIGEKTAGPVLVPLSRREFDEVTGRAEASDPKTRSRASVHPIGPPPIRGARQAADGGR